MDKKAFSKDEILKELKSRMANEARENSCNKKNTSPPIISEPTTTPNTQVVESMASKYKNAWKEVFDKLPVWRQKEISMLSEAKDFDSRYLTEFAQQVVSIAEK